MQHPGPTRYSKDCEIAIGNHYHLMVYRRHDNNHPYFDRPEMETLLRLHTGEEGRLWVRFLQRHHDLLPALERKHHFRQHGDELIDREMIHFDLGLRLCADYSPDLEAEIIIEWRRLKFGYLPGETPAAPPPTVPQTPEEMYDLWLEGLVRARQEMKAIEGRQGEIQAIQQRDHGRYNELHEDHMRRIAELEGGAAAFLLPDGYVTALGFCRYHKIGDPAAPRRLGMYASNKAHNQGVRLTKIPAPHTQYQTVNAYPRDFLEQAARELGLVA